MNKGKLYIVATPIGNLGDITLRALETLKDVDLILCEDTRVTVKLLNHYKIKTKTLSYHQHSDNKKVKQIEELLSEGKDLALVTDAGTPGISDPGGKLVDVIASEASQSRGAKAISNPRDCDVVVPPPRNDISVIPGPSAVIAALSVSGFPTDKFIFLGFPPNKNKRQKFFKEVAEAKYTVVFYESCHRIKKCLQNLDEVLDKDREVVICRELTKKFESVYRGDLQELNEMEILEKGEFVVVIRSR